MLSPQPDTDRCSVNSCTLLFLHAPWNSQSSFPHLLLVQRMGLGAGMWFSECPREGNQVYPSFEPLENYVQLVGVISKC